jgi:hypothetical protein
VNETLNWQNFLILVAGACLTVALLSLPGYGWYVATPFAAAGVGAYGFAIRAASRDERSDWAKEKRWVQAWRLVLCLGTGVLLVLPWLSYRGATGDPPHFTRLGLVFSLIAAAVVPSLLLASFARDRRGKGGWRLLARTFVKHPIAFPFAVAFLPLSFVGLELLLTLMMRYQEVYQFFLVDLLPRPPEIFYSYGLPYVEMDYGRIEFLVLPMSYFTKLHLTRLSEGYNLVMGLLGSISLNSDNGFNPWSIRFTPQGFGRLRFFYTSVVGLVMLSALAVQARWLGLLSTLHTRRSAS